MVCSYSRLAARFDCNELKAAHSETRRPHLFFLPSWLLFGRYQCEREEVTSMLRYNSPIQEKSQGDDSLGEGKGFEKLYRIAVHLSSIRTPVEQTSTTTYTTLYRRRDLLILHHLLLCTLSMSTLTSGISSSASSSSSTISISCWAALRCFSKCFSLSSQA